MDLQKNDQPADDFQLRERHQKITVDFERIATQLATKREIYHKAYHTDNVSEVTKAHSHEAFIKNLDTLLNIAEKYENALREVTRARMLLRVQKNKKPPTK